MTNSDTLKYFRVTAYLEGISLLILFGVAMPLKYLYHQPQAVHYVGWVHGLFFVAYVGLLAMVSSGNNWPGKRVMQALVAAVVPFGTFIFDRTLRHAPQEKTNPN